jgi:uncharacterized protein YggU (UPF0235/DUF167 family)
MLNQYIEKLTNNKEIYLKVIISPGVDKTSFLSIMTDGTIKIAVSAPLENGEANQDLIKFLSG